MADKLNRIDYTDSSNNLAGENVSTEEPLLEGQYKGQYDWLTHCFRYGGAELMLKEVLYEE